jgi:uncharacterized protein
MDAAHALRDFLAYVLGHLAEHRADASIAHHEEPGGRLIFEVTLHRDDADRIAGRQGHTLRAIRSLMQAAAVRDNLRVTLKIIAKSGEPLPEPSPEA